MLPIARAAGSRDALPFFGRPDPEDALDVLAFVLCPPKAFAPRGDAEELEAVKELLKPAKTEAVRRWVTTTARKRRC